MIATVGMPALPVWDENQVLVGLVYAQDAQTFRAHWLDRELAGVAPTAQEAGQLLVDGWGDHREAVTSAAEARSRTELGRTDTVAPEGT